ncbi:hypothetical protein LPU83_pLPU83b_0579 (plasmid) [Rhizobium favelukesii]|uniref:Uncharacterized protein n=1 Tax=Rhizobium favelukesii TaxID=348824 RepID=W6RI92_9HYPH|nr:hypothetical protein LPU83_pLPU83b_0579 [Rhizobium favelukesii]
MITLANRQTAVCGIALACVAGFDGRLLSSPHWRDPHFADGSAWGP